MMDEPSMRMVAQVPAAGNAAGVSPALHSVGVSPFSRLVGRIPGRWTATRRRRRLLFLALAAPGFFAVFATPLHRNFFLMLAGFLLFAAAAVFHIRTEPLFEAAAVTGPQPAADPSSPAPKVSRHA
jgi:hypothetical protein